MPACRHRFEKIMELGVYAPVARICAECGYSEDLSLPPVNTTTPALPGTMRGLRARQARAEAALPPSPMERALSQSAVDDLLDLLDELSDDRP